MCRFGERFGGQDVVYRVHLPAGHSNADGIVGDIAERGDEPVGHGQYGDERYHRGRVDGAGRQGEQARQNRQEGDLHHHAAGQQGRDHPPELAALTRMLLGQGGLDEGPAGPRPVHGPQYRLSVGELHYSIAGLGDRGVDGFVGAAADPPRQPVHCPHRSHASSRDGGEPRIHAHQDHQQGRRCDGRADEGGQLPGRQGEHVHHARAQDLAEPAGVGGSEPAQGQGGYVVADPSVQRRQQFDGHVESAPNAAIVGQPICDRKPAEGG